MAASFSHRRHRVWAKTVLASYPARHRLTHGTAIEAMANIMLAREELRIDSDRWQAPLNEARRLNRVVASLGQRPGLAGLKQLLRLRPCLDSNLMISSTRQVGDHAFDGGRILLGACLVAPSNVWQPPSSALN